MKYCAFISLNFTGPTLATAELDKAQRQLILIFIDQFLQSKCTRVYHSFGRIFVVNES